MGASIHMVCNDDITKIEYLLPTNGVGKTYSVSNCLAII
jgi:hypothetical protein